MGSQKCWNLLDISIRREDTLECTRRFHVTSRPAAGDYIRRALGRRGVLVDWDRLGARTSLKFYQLCELVNCQTPSGRCVDPLGTTLELRPQCELGSWRAERY
ncbi:hypothetical protein AVEN_70202-1 [Araneus ventricosus]|uniref:Uncharacterized protein n=1 Tax=Araneus ventricosus TaxID=182803 RepID=A0A4Y2FEE2_ARAVE|nr:hypothetical protein AVEN_70202-1 [Araneus ventricosus]